MQHVLLGIRNPKKARFLLDFLKQLDFIEILQSHDDNGKQVPGVGQLDDDTLLNAPVLSREEIENIEQVGKEFRNWKIDEF